jgi:hypothetical protein
VVESLARRQARRGRQAFDEALSQQLEFLAAEEATKGRVHERQRAVREHPADEVRLALDHVAVAGLAAPERGLLFATLGQVDGRADVAHEFAIGAIAGRAVRQDPAVLVVVATDAELQLQRTARGETLVVFLERTLQIVRMNAFRQPLPNDSSSDLPVNSSQRRLEKSWPPSVPEVHIITGEQSAMLRKRRSLSRSELLTLTHCSMSTAARYSGAMRSNRKCCSRLDISAESMSANDPVPWIAASIAKSDSSAAAPSLRTCGSGSPPRP